MATVTRESIGTLNDKLTVKVGKEDYYSAFEKTLKNYSKQANIPGFRKGMVPVGVIKKMHGNGVFTEEVLKAIEKGLTDFMQEEKLDIFAQPLPLENNLAGFDMNNPGEYAFSFEVGLKPSFELADLGSAKITGYKVTVTDEMVQQEVDRVQTRAGKMNEPETVTTEENVLNLRFTESDADGNPVEGGISKDNSLLVKYFAEPVRSQWMGKKAEDTLVITPATAFDEKEREWVIQDLGLKADDPEAAQKHFLLTLTKIGLLDKAEMNEELYKQVYPNSEIATEEEFREALKKDIQQYWDAQGRNQIHDQIYHQLLENTKIEFPESFLKKWMLEGDQNKKDDKGPKTPEEVEAAFPGFRNQLSWTLITDKVATENQISATADEIRNFARRQVLSYMGGMGQADESAPWIEDYANRMMQDKKFVEDTYHRIVTEKIFAWAEGKINPEEKPISMEDFVKMQEEHKHHH